MAEPGTSRLSVSSRVEAFSDGVFAIAVTLLVLELHVPEGGSGGSFLDELLAAWPSYLAYLAAFFTIASLWLSHHNTFSRVARVDPELLVLNLLLLLGVSLVPWPTAVVASAMREGDPADQTTAILLYTLVSLVVTAAWAGLTRRLVPNPHLLEDAADRQPMRRRTAINWLAAVPIVLAGTLSLLAPLVSLLIFLAVPLFFFVLTIRTPAGAEDPS